LVEQHFRKVKVRGSNPRGGSNGVRQSPAKRDCDFFTNRRFVEIGNTPFVRVRSGVQILSPAQKGIV
ncbi:MAG: hypothetical protein AAB738_00885, partial [Patescibacteria group bacterium]